MLAFCILGVHVSCLYFWYKVENQSSTQQTCSKMNTYMSHRGGMKRKNPTLCSCVLNNFRHSSLQLFIFQKPSNASCWQRVHSNVISARVGQCLFCLPIDQQAFYLLAIHFCISVLSQELPRVQAQYIGVLSLWGRYLPDIPTNVFLYAS